jgi:hypothetical protein
MNNGPRDTDFARAGEPKGQAAAHLSQKNHRLNPPQPPPPSPSFPDYASVFRNYTYGAARWMTTCVKYKLSQEHYPLNPPPFPSSPPPPLSSQSEEERGKQVYHFYHNGMGVLNSDLLSKLPSQKLNTLISEFSSQQGKITEQGGLTWSAANYQFFIQEQQERSWIQLEVERQAELQKMQVAQQPTTLLDEQARKIKSIKEKLVSELSTPSESSENFKKEKAELSQRLATLIEMSEQEKLQDGIGSDKRAPIISTKNLEQSSQEHVIHSDEKKEFSVEKDEPSEQAEASSLAIIVRKSQEYILASKEAEKEEAEAEKQEEIKKANLQLYSYYHRRKQEAEVKRFSSKAENIIEDIFAESKKIKYCDLVNFIKNTLEGKVDSKTKSSLRKLIIADGQTVFIHQRHGRDRKKYVPVEAVKELKIVLQNLGINPKRECLLNSVSPK